MNKKKIKIFFKKIRWGRLAAICLPLIALILLGWFTWNKMNPLQLKSDVYIAEYKEEFDPLGNLKSLFMDSTDQIEVSGSVDTSSIGDYPMSYTYQNIKYPFTVSVKDTKAPEITLKDVTTDTVHPIKAEDFIESIQDSSTYTYMMDNGEDSKQPGKYKIRFSAKDKYGNMSEKYATLTRIKDEKAPTIKDFSEKLELIQGYNFDEKLYSPVDDLDSNPSMDINKGNLNTSEPGEYTVTYTLKDRSGNESQYIQTLKVVPDPDHGKKIVYLTFDDGPSSNTPKILDILKENDALATFFVIGTKPQYFDEMKKITDAGHSIALHTYSHDYAQIYSNDQAYYDDLQKIHDLVKEKTGIDSNIMRFPGGSSNSISALYNQGIMSRVTQGVVDKGYTYFDWNADSGDASGNNVPVSTLVENCKNTIGPEKIVLLLHDTDLKGTTVDALPQIIQNYKDAGYVFRAMNKNTYAPHHEVLN